MSTSEVTSYGDKIWRDFSSLSTFFSPAIIPLQKKLEINSSEILSSLGEFFGRKAAEKLKDLDLEGTLGATSEMWKSLGLGKLEVESTNPLTIVIRDCVICGQIPEIGSLFKCAFHEGFLTGLLSSKLGKNIRIVQEAGFEGESGLWTRRYITDVNL